MEKQTKRQKVIAAAIVLFRSTHNVKKVSLEDVAREAGVSPTTIYNNFGSREQLIYEIIKIMVRENLASARSLIRSEIPFSQKITGIINNKTDMAVQFNGEIINKLISQDKAIAPFIDEIYNKEIRPLWLEILADGKKQGYISSSLDDEALLLYLDALRAGFAEKKDSLLKFRDNPGMIQQLTRIMFYGFLKKDITLFKKERG
jgi:AcrR family transcriptional regulator